MKKIYLLLFLLVTLISCEKEEISNQNFEEEISSSTNKLNQLFKKSNFKDGFLKKNLKIDSQIDKLKINGAVAIEYSTHLKKKKHIVLDNINVQVKYSLLKIELEKTEEYQILKYVTYDETFDIDKISKNNLKSFTGTIFTYNMQGEKIKAEAINNGKLESTIKDFSGETNNEDDNLKMAPREDGWIYIVTWEVEDWYNTSGGGMVYTSTRVTSYRSEWVYQGPYGNPSNNPVQHEHRDEPNYTGSATSSANNHVVEIIIDESIKNYSCLYQTIEAVLNCQGSLYKETMASFLVDPKYDLRIAIGECQSQEWCTKEDPSSNEMIITIDPRGGLTNPIDMAATLLHESIHAEIMRYMNNVTNGEASALSRKDLFESYERYCAANLGRQIDHPYMAANYITPIAKTLQTLDNNRYPDLEYYKVFAIEGIGEWGFDANEYTMANYLEFRNEVSANFSINCSNN